MFVRDFNKYIKVCIIWFISKSSNNVILYKILFIIQGDYKVSKQFFFNTVVFFIYVILKFELFVLGERKPVASALLFNIQVRKKFT